MSVADSFHIPFVRIPDRLTDAAIIDVIARVGAATPEQIGALVSGTTPRNLFPSDVLRLQRRVAHLASRGVLFTAQISTTLSVLRSVEYALYRPGPARFSYDPLSGEMKRVLESMEQYMAMTGEPNVPEPWLIRYVLSGYARPRDARRKLNQMVLKGVLEQEQPRSRRRLTLVTLTKLGHDEIERWYAARGRRAPTPTRAPRIDQSVHHLLVVEAALRILTRTGGKFVRLYGDESLRSATRKSIQTEAGSTTEPLPDGRLIYREEGGKLRKIDIEILVGKYTDEQIVTKYKTLAPAGTLFFACTRRLCERARKLAGVRPLLLH